jgi:hypothetical protein
MPDRELTKEELAKFVREATEKKLCFNALDTFMKETTKPTLHDLCITELNAKIEGQTEIIIEQGVAIETLKLRLKALEEKQ